jgi:dimethylargininase
MLALTHAPSTNMDQGQRTHIARVRISYDLAVQQHAAYCKMLRDCGADVATLDVNRDQPDGTFIEDTAVVLDEIAVLASMGAESRRSEPMRIEPVLRQYHDLQRIEAPATLEGGDVLRVRRTLLVGLSARTNWAGVQALECIVRRYGYRVLAVPVRHCLHLKTACTALPDDSLLVNPSWLDVESLHEFRKVSIPPEESWAANTLSINGKVCLAAAHVQTADLLVRRGFTVRIVDLSEFAKAEGCVTCLSLLLGHPIPTSAGVCAVRN